MLVAELRVVPIGSGSSMERTMERVVAALDETGLEYKVGSLATTLQADRIEALLDATKAVHEAVAGEAPRILLELSVDHRLDKEESMASLARVKR